MKGYENVKIQTTNHRRHDSVHRFVAIVAALAFVLTCSAAAHAQKSLVIGIDALGSHGLRAADTPNIDRLIEGTFGRGAYQGAFTPHAFVGGVLGTASQQPTVSGPGWTSILTGVWTDKHRITGNSFFPQDLVNHPLYLKTLEQNVADIYTASIINWSPIDTPALFADPTGNGFVDFEDLTVLLANWNEPVDPSQGNLVSPDSTPVNFEDLTQSLAEWTGPGPAASPEASLGGAAVPEPSTLMLAVCGLLGVVWRRRCPINSDKNQSTAARFPSGCPRTSWRVAESRSGRP
ncbi:MAG: alkaline phosphatase family protein [Planctomycetes bacterium]|nr:alkaline phosphatase family protein [Planctomycetota bacterium]